MVKFRSNEGLPLCEMSVAAPAKPKDVNSKASTEAVFKAAKRGQKIVFSPWWILNRIMVDTEQAAGGVYELADSTQTVIYIGSSDNVQRRLGQHLSEMDTCIKNGAIKYRIEYTSDYKSRESEHYNRFVARNMKPPRCNDVSTIQPGESAFVSAAEGDCPQPS